MAIDDDAADLRMDPGTLYREELFTDRRVGTIRVLTPVQVDGAVDPGRAVVYMGETQMLTQAGVLPLGFDIEARSLREAIEGFAAGARAAADRTIKELEAMRREAASSIIVPGRMPGGGGPGGLRRPGSLEFP